MSGVSFSTYLCSECDAPLIEAPSGLVCSRDWACGSVRSGQKLPPEVRRRHAALLMGIQECQGHGNDILMGGVPHKVKGKVSRPLNGKMPELEENQVLGVNGGDVLILEPA